MTKRRKTDYTQCPECGKKYESHQAMRAHAKIKHEGQNLTESHVSIKAKVDSILSTQESIRNTLSLMFKVLAGMVDYQNAIIYNQVNGSKLTVDEYLKIQDTGLRAEFDQKYGKGSE